MKVGTTVTHRTITNYLGGQAVTDATVTLQKVTPDEVTIGMQASMSVQGSTSQVIPGKTYTIKAKLDKPADALPGAATDKPQETVEELSVNGKSYSCKLVTVEENQGGDKTITKTWTCDEVPGGLVKMEFKDTGPNARTWTTELTSVQEPK